MREQRTFHLPGSLAAAVMVLGWSGPLLAQEPSAEPVVLTATAHEHAVVLSTVDLAGHQTEVGKVVLPGQILGAVVLGAYLYVARGLRGLTVVDVHDPASPVVAGTHLVGQEVTAVLVKDGSVVAIVQSLQVLTADVTDPLSPLFIHDGQPVETLPGDEDATAGDGTGPESVSGPEAADQGADEEPPMIEAKVRKVKGDWVFLDAGTDQGVEEGMGFEILSQKKVKKPDPVSGDMAWVPSDEQIAVVEIEKVSASGCAGKLMRGQTAAQGDRAVQVKYWSRVKLVKVPNVPGLTQLLVQLRPTINMGRLGFGMLNEAALSHYFKFPMKLELGLMPFGFSVSGGTGAPINVMALLSWYTKRFEVGLGLGYNHDQALPNAGFSIAAGIRMGSLDGANLRLLFTFALLERSTSDEGHRLEFLFGSIQYTLTVPLSDMASLLLDGGWGTNGWLFVMTGAKIYVKGNGGPGTVAIPVTVGYMRLFDRACGEDLWGTKCEGSFVQGPAVSVGVDLRF